MKTITSSSTKTGVMSLPDQSISRDVLLEKYAKGDEKTVVDIQRRVAKGLTQAEPKKMREHFYKVFCEAQGAGFIPAGRILSAAGTDLKATLINCFVQPIGDATRGVVDGVPGIFDALSESAQTMRKSGGVGYGFSAIRPKNAIVNGTGSIASGPVSYMHVFDRMCTTVSSAGARRGAQMACLSISHPDVEIFIREKSTKGHLTQFNLSVTVTDDFLDALKHQRPFELVHIAEPSDELKEQGAFCRSDGMWVYKTIDPVKLWDTIMEQTYDHAEPGILFISGANRDNNLRHLETFEATNPCAEQFLPPYGSCCLGSINLTKFVEKPFTSDASIDLDRLASVVKTSVRMLDNVLDVTHWPLEKQKVEAMNKRRIGLGFTGLGDAILMMNLRYDSESARDFAEQISKVMRDTAYRASVELAKEKGPFPLFTEQYLDSGFTQRLPEDIRDDIRQHGIRNSHLLSIAPCGTISLSVADNASNGIEPAFAWYYTRKKKTADGGEQHYAVVDHAFRVYQVNHSGVDPEQCTSEELAKLVSQLPDHFVSALDISARDHLAMVAAVQPYIDSAISKTVNVPADYPFEDFKDLYSLAASSGLKGLATFRPNDVTGSVLSTDTPAAVDAGGELTLNQSDFDRRLTLDYVPEPVLASLRWPKRPSLPNGNPAWTYVVKTEQYNFAVFVGYTTNGTNHPFEVWVNGAEQPRGLGAIAKAISMDMRSNDRAFLKAKLDSLEKAKGDDGFMLSMPPDGRNVQVPSLVSGFAKLLKHCINELEGLPVDAAKKGQGSTDLIGAPLTPMMDALMSPREPKTTEGTMSWAVDIRNHATNDDFAVFVKELVTPDGQRRPFSVWLSGEYPRAFDGLCKVLSYDMRIIDAAWVGAKLRSLSHFAEPMGDFMAPVPGSEKSANYPSTVAYIARLIMHRYTMLGILDDDGYPAKEAGLMDAEYHNVVKLKRLTKTLSGKLCDECHTLSVIRRDGCDFCSECGAMGACG